MGCQDGEEFNAIHLNELNLILMHSCDGCFIGGITGTCVTAILSQTGFGLEKKQRRMIPIPEEPSSPVAVHVSLLSEGRSEELHDVHSQKKENSTKPVVIRRSSINVASLSMADHIIREDSFDSAPGDFIHTSLPTKVNNMKNRLLFPITYDPLNFGKRLVSRGCQTSVRDEIEALDIPQSQRAPTVYEELEITDAAMSTTNHHAIKDADIWDNSPPWVQGIKRTFPLWATVVLLIITRLPQLGIKSLLQSTTPNIGGQVGSLGVFELSPSLVISLDKVLGEDNIKWQFQLLYVPFILPFVAVSCFTLLMFKG